MGDLARDDQPAAPVRELDSAGEASRIVEPVAALGNADVGLQLQPFILVV
jgi:hypothetical protein